MKKGRLRMSFLLAGVVLFTGLLSVVGGERAHAEAIEMRFSHHLPPISPVSKALDTWAKRVETDTAGKVKIVMFPAGSLAKGREGYSATAGGVCDIAFVNNVYERKRWALNNVVNLLSLPIPTDERGVEIWDKLWEKFPVMKEEYKDVKVVGHSINPYSSMHTKKLVKTPEDMKSMKIAAMGDKTKMLAGLHITPVGVPANEWYLSLEKGVIDGVFAPIGLMVERGIEEVVPFHLDMTMGQGGNSIIINQAKYDSLPAEVKAVIDGLWDYTNKLVGDATDGLSKDSWEKCAAKGHTNTVLTKAEMKPWLAAAEPSAEYWIKSNAKKGPTQEMYEYAQKLIDELE